MCRSRALWITFVCVISAGFAPCQDFKVDAYVTGLTAVGKAGDASSCPPIVWSVAPDTPAAKAGIQPGDRIIAIEGHRGLDVLQARPFLRTENPTPVTLELEGERGLYTVTLARIKASVLYEREGLRIGPDGGLWAKDATEAEIQRISKQGPEPPNSRKVFPVDHYPANLELYYPGFELFVWEDPKSITVGGLEDGPARRAGIHYGDQIISVNGVDPNGRSISELERLFSSTHPSTMNLVVDRDGTKKTMTFELAKASEIAKWNHKKLYDGHMIPSVVPEAYLHCFSAPKAP